MATDGQWHGNRLLTNNDWTVVYICIYIYIHIYIFVFMFMFIGRGVTTIVSLEGCQVFKIFLQFPNKQTTIKKQKIT